MLTNTQNNMIDNRYDLPLPNPATACTTKRASKQATILICS